MSAGGTHPAEARPTPKVVRRCGECNGTHPCSQVLRYLFVEDYRPGTDFAGKALSAMRKGFGGHDEKAV